MNELQHLMDDIAARCNLSPTPADWEYELYRLIETGFHSFFKYKREGMRREDMTALQRASRKLNGWIDGGVFFPMDQWLRMYHRWKA